MRHYYSDLQTWTDSLDTDNFAGSKVSWNFNERIPRHELLIRDIVITIDELMSIRIIHNNCNSACLGSTIRVVAQIRTIDVAVQSSQGSSGDTISHRKIQTCGAIDISSENSRAETAGVVLRGEVGFESGRRTCDIVRWDGDV